MTATPVTIARRAQITRDEAARLYLAMRRADAARNGYRGPLTRAELAEQTSRQFARAQMAAAIRHAR